MIKNDGGGVFNLVSVLLSESVQRVIVSCNTSCMQNFFFFFFKFTYRITSSLLEVLKPVKCFYFQEFLGLGQSRAYKCHGLAVMQLRKICLSSRKVIKYLHLNKKIMNFKKVFQALILIISHFFCDIFSLFIGFFCAKFSM